MRNVRLIVQNLCLPLHKWNTRFSNMSNQWPSTPSNLCRRVFKVPEIHPQASRQLKMARHLLHLLPRLHVNRFQKAVETLRATHQEPQNPFLPL